MKKIIFISSLISNLFLITSYAQNTDNKNINNISTVQTVNGEHKGIVIDADKNTPLPYATIYVLHQNRGVISNETGNFSINISGLAESDTVCFQYIGYETRYMTVNQLDTSSVVYLKVQIINLNDVIVFGNTPDPESIVKMVLKNKDLNYKKATCKLQAFIRRRDISDFTQLDLTYKRSTIPGLDEEMLQMLEDKIPKNPTSYSDFLGDLYFTKNPDDSVRFKIGPVRTVELKEKDITELDQLEKLFEDLVAGTGENEYWQIKSGIFGEKFNKDEINPGKDKDSLSENQREVKYFSNSILSQLSYPSLNDKDQWEFLYHTGRYDYTLAGGASVNGEDVYIIDFKPRNSGLYTGRMFISMSTYALVRADYEYGKDKIGQDIQLLGIGYTETGFSGSVYFEKYQDNYRLKYFSKRETSRASVNRDLALYQKKKRFLWDEKEKEFKLEMDIKVENEGSFEYLVLNEKEISEQQFEDFQQPEKMEVIYVDQFDDKLWSGYPIIEPTKQMKEYRKQELPEVR